MKKKRKPYTNPRTGQLLDRKTGRFLSKPGAIKPTVNPGASVMDLLSQRADPQRIARTLERRAYAGDSTAMELLIKAVELQKPHPPAQGGGDLSRLSVPQLDVLYLLTSIAQGEAIDPEKEVESALHYIASLQGLGDRSASQLADQIIYAAKGPPIVALPDEPQPPPELEAVTEPPPENVVPISPRPGFNPNDPNLKEVQDRAREKREAEEWLRLYGRPKGDGLGVTELSFRRQSYSNDGPINWRKN